MTDRTHRPRQAAEDGAGVLVTTHHMGEAEQCDRLVMMAGGRVVTEGPVDRIVSGATAVEVRTDRWPRAYEALERAGIPAALVGPALRVPAVDESRVRRVLEADGVAASVRAVPATLEETFVALSREAA